MSFLSTAFNVVKRNSDIKLTEILFLIVNNMRREKQILSLLS